MTKFQSGTGGVRTHFSPLQLSLFICLPSPFPSLPFLIPFAFSVLISLLLPPSFPAPRITFHHILRLPFLLTPIFPLFSLFFPNFCLISNLFPSFFPLFFLLFSSFFLFPPLFFFLGEGYFRSCPCICFKS